MITAKHHPVINRFFRHYVDMLLKRHFHKIQVTGDIPDEGRSIMLIGNHFSWWDGFFAFWLNNHLLHKRFHVMMLEEQLAKRRFFRGIGAFSVQPASRSMIESLDYAAGLLEKSDHMLVMYPQGRIETSYAQQIRFGKGVCRILEKVRGTRPEILFYVALTDYFSNPKPTLNIYLQPFSMRSEKALANMEDRYNAFYQSCITLQKEP
ncbi:MAG: lysophospholipid acyltransferase family protein [Bacteroidales bacterium]